MRRVRIDGHVERHAGEVQQGAHGVAAQEEADEVADGLVREESLEPEDQVEQEEHPRPEPLEGVDAVPGDVRWSSRSRPIDRSAGTRARFVSAVRKPVATAISWTPAMFRSVEQDQLDGRQEHGPGELAPRKPHRADERQRRRGRGEQCGA